MKRYISPTIIFSALMMALVFMSIDPLATYTTKTIQHVFGISASEWWASSLRFIKSQSQGLFLLLILNGGIAIFEQKSKIILTERQFEWLRSQLENIRDEVLVVKEFISRRYGSDSVDQISSKFFSGCDAYFDVDCFIDVKLDDESVTYKVETEYTVECGFIKLAIAKTVNGWDHARRDLSIHEFVPYTNHQDVEVKAQLVRSGAVVQVFDNSSRKFLNLPMEICSETPDIMVFSAALAPHKAANSRVRLRSVIELPHFRPDKRFVYWYVDRPLYLSKLKVRVRGISPDKVRVISPVTGADSSLDLLNEDRFAPVPIGSWMFEGQIVVVAWD